MMGEASVDPKTPRNFDLPLNRNSVQKRQQLAAIEQRLSATKPGLSEGVRRTLARTAQQLKDELGD